MWLHRVWGGEALINSPRPQLIQWNIVGSIRSQSWMWRPTPPFPYPWQVPSNVCMLISLCWQTVFVSVCFSDFFESYVCMRVCVGKGGVRYLALGWIEIFWGSSVRKWAAMLKHSPINIYWELLTVQPLLGEFEVFPPWHQLCPTLFRFVSLPPCPAAGRGGRHPYSLTTSRSLPVASGPSMTIIVSLEMRGLFFLLTACCLAPFNGLLFSLSVDPKLFLRNLFLF